MVEEEGVEEDKVVDEDEMNVIEVVWFRAFCLFLCFDSSAFPCVPSTLMQVLPVHVQKV